MTKWEYKRIQFHIIDEHNFELYGDEGWELCGIAVIPERFNESLETVAYFKRPLEDNKE